MSRLFLRTLREDPADAEFRSHQLLVRAGYIRRQAPGRVRLAAARPEGQGQGRGHRPRGDGRRPAPRRCTSRRCCPREPYEATGRWTEYGDGIFRLQDRKGADYLLAPTHEEVFTLLVKDLYSSYKDLPLSIYQIQDKYRDEARPRAGLLRGREFTMKDAYSFDIDDAGLDASYEAAARRLRARSSRGSGSSTSIVSGATPGRWAARAARSSCTRRRRRRHLRALARRLRGERRGVHGRSRTAPRRRSGLPAARGLRLAGHPHDRDPRRPA